MTDRNFDYEFHLSIKESYYLNDFNQVNMEIKSMTFGPNGHIFMNGFDIEGEFEYLGELRDDHMIFRKQYVGSHSLFYVGKFKNDRIECIYCYEEHELLDAKLALDDGIYNAIFEFNTTPYVIIDEDNVHSLILSRHNSIKYKGLAYIDDKYYRAKVTLFQNEVFRLEYDNVNFNGKFEGKFDAVEKKLYITL
jgi:hypothetical protein